MSESYGEQVSHRAAVEMLTKNAAYATHEEKSKGTIEVGKLADLVVLDRDPLQVEPDEVSRIRVLATIVAGRIVYASEMFRAMQSRSGRGRQVRRRR